MNLSRRILSFAAIATVPFLSASCDDITGTQTAVLAGYKLKMTAKPPGAKPRKFKGKSITSGHADTNSGPAFSSFNVTGFDAPGIAMFFDDGVAAAHTVRYFLTSDDNASLNAWVEAQIRETLGDGVVSGLAVTTSSIDGTAVCPANDPQALAIRGLIRFEGSLVISSGSGEASIPMTGTIKIAGVGDAFGQFGGLTKR